MTQPGKSLSMQVVATVAEAVGVNRKELPPLQETISADALDTLFHEGKEPEGAYAVFPYAGVWVLVQSNGNVSVFDEFRATNYDTVSDPDTDDEFILLATGGEQFVLREDDIPKVHAIIDTSEDSEKAWQNTLEYAKSQSEASRSEEDVGG